MRRVLFSLVGLLAFGFAHADRSVTGSYQLRVPEGVSKLARISGQRIADSRLALHVNGRFTLEIGDSVRHGRYRVDEDHLTLDVTDGSILGGLIREGRVTIEGLDFERAGATYDARRFPTDDASGRVYRIEKRNSDALANASTGRIRKVDGVLTAGDPLPGELPAVVPAPVAVPPVAVFTPDPVVPVVPPAVRTRRVSLLKSDDCLGVWTVRRNGLEEKGSRMDLRKDGTFRFGMTGATSEGTWTVVDGNIELVWTKIDG
ncbi:hypothetical protein EON79_23135, partial [bacterium]